MYRHLTVDIGLFDDMCGWDVISALCSCFVPFCCAVELNGELHELPPLPH